MAMAKSFQSLDRINRIYKIRIEKAPALSGSLIFEGSCRCGRETSALPATASGRRGAEDSESAGRRAGDRIPGQHPDIATEDRELHRRFPGTQKLAPALPSPCRASPTRRARHDPCSSVNV